MRISESEIRRVTNDAKNYRWGERHSKYYNEFVEYNARSVGNNQIILSSSMNYNGFENDVRLNVLEDGRILSHACDCRFHKKNSACGHVAALAFFWNATYFNVTQEDIANAALQEANTRAWKEQMRAANFEEARKARLLDYNRRMLDHTLRESKDVLASLTNVQEESLVLQEDHFGVQVELEFLKRDNGYQQDTFAISGKVGVGKMFVLKDMQAFLRHIDNEEYVSYGKKFGFTHEISHFTKQSQDLIKLLRRCVGKQTYGDKRYADVDEELMDECIQYCKMGQIQTNLFIEESNEPFLLKGHKIDDDVKVGVYQVEHVGTYKSLVGKKYAYKVNDNHIQYLACNQTANLRMLLHRLSIDNLQFEKQDFDAFCVYLNDMFEGVVRIEGDVSELPKHESLLEVYFDHENGNLEVSAVGSYEGDAVRYDLLDPTFHKPLSTGTKKVLALLHDYLSIRDEAPFLAEASLQKDETLFFLEQAPPIIQEFAQVYVSDSLKNMNLQRSLGIQVGVRVESNLLKVDVSSLELSSEEIMEVLKSYRKKKNFHTLKSGEIIPVLKEDFEELDHFMEEMHVDEKSLASEMELPLYDAYRMNQHLANMENVTGRESDDFKELLEHIQTVQIQETKILPKYQTILKDYQKTGVKWLMHLSQYSFGGILADDMGLGKTIQMIAFLESVQEVGTTSIVVCPASLMLNWKDELDKFDSSLKSVCVYGPKSLRKEIIENYASYDLLITTYDYVKRDQEIYEECSFVYAILDEAQYIKNHGTKAAKSVKALKANTRFALTGTPIENSLAELWSIFDYLMPNYLFNYHYFKRAYETPIVKQKNVEVSVKLKQMVEPFILRRKKEDVLLELPDKIEKILRFQFKEEEEKLYLSKLSLVNKELNMQVHQGEFNKFQILKMLTELRQICCEPRVLYENITETSSKLEGCLEVIESLKDSGKHILLFSSFTRILDLLAVELQQKGISYLLLTGDVSKAKRKEMVDAFQEGDVDIFLISLKAGSVGLNLTRAQAVIHYDPWWNVSAQNQATDRAYRIGQEHNVTVYNLIMKDSLEERILEMQKRKKEIMDMFVEDSSGSISTLSSDDILDLLQREN